MKKDIFTVVLLSIMAVIGSFMIYQFNYKTEEKKEDTLEGYSYYVGYLSNVKEEGIDKIISDYDSFKQYFVTYTNYMYDGSGNIVSSTCDNILLKYNEEFFTDKSLAVKYISLGSGSITISSVYGIIDGEKISFEYEKNSPDIGTMDMSGYFLIVEVSKNIKEIKN
jgi:hypothetical protein